MQRHKLREREGRKGECKCRLERERTIGAQTGGRKGKMKVVLSHAAFVRAPLSLPPSHASSPSSKGINFHLEQMRE